MKSTIPTSLSHSVCSLSLAGLLLWPCAVVQAASLLNVDFGAGVAPQKTGPAVVGETAIDFWNYYNRTAPDGSWKTFGVLSNLALADGTGTAIGMTVANAPGNWGITTLDPMYQEYIYPLNNGNITLTLSGLPEGTYEVFVYSGHGNHEVTAGGTSYGIKTTFDYPVMTPLVWTEGVQYVRFDDVAVDAGVPLVLTVRPAFGGYALLAGLQIRSKAPANQPPIAILSVSPVIQLSGSQNLVAIAPDNQHALLTLDGSQSSDPDGDELDYTWFDGLNPIATGVVAAKNLGLGSHVLTLEVSDGVATATDAETVEVLTAAEAIGLIASVIEESNLHPNRQRPLLVSLSVAAAACDRGKPRTGANVLRAFQLKVNAMVGSLDPDLAQQLMDDAESIISVLKAGSSVPNKGITKRGIPL